MAIAGLLIAAAAPPPPPAPDDPTFEQWAAPRRAEWLRTQEEQAAEQKRRASLARLQRDYDLIRAAVAANIDPLTNPGNDPAISAEVRQRHRVNLLTGLVLNSGYRAAQFTHPAAARTLVRAWDNIFGGDADALVLAAPMVMVAKQVRIERLPDNSSYAVYQVSEPIKASLPIGSELRVELNGPGPSWDSKAGQPAPPPPMPNFSNMELARDKSAVFFMAPGAMIQPMPRPGKPVSIFGPMPIRGETVMPDYHSGTNSTTLAAIRTAATAQLCSPGYVPVAAGIDLPHRC